MKLSVLVLVISVFTSDSLVILQPNETIFNQLKTSDPLKLEPIGINENLEANTQIANLTQLIHTQLNRLLKTDLTTQFIEIVFVKLTSPSDYFTIEETKISYNEFIISNIDLRTTKKQIDSESICQFDKTCSIKIQLTARLSTPENQVEKTIDVPLTLTVEINDLNDNKPEFLQDEIKIELDLDNDQIWPSNGLVQIPLKLGYDLDVNKANRIQTYTLQPVEFYNLSTLSDGLLITLNSSNEKFRRHVTNEPMQTLLLTADDQRNKAHQTIELKFKIDHQKRTTDHSIFVMNSINVTRSLNQTMIPLNLPIHSSCPDNQLEFSVDENQFNKSSEFYFNRAARVLNVRLFNEPSSAQVGTYRILVRGKCGELSETASAIINLIDIVPRHVSTSTRSLKMESQLNIVSALNDLEIRSAGDETNIFELIFRSNSQDHGVNDSYVTLAYLMGKNAVMEANRIGEFRLERTDRLDVNVDKLVEVNEMRNGLYAVMVKRQYFERIRQLNSGNIGGDEGIEYFIEFKLLTVYEDSKIPEVSRYLCFKIPSDLVKESSALANKLQTKQTLTLEVMKILYYETINWLNVNWVRCLVHPAFYYLNISENW